MSTSIVHAIVIRFAVWPHVVPLCGIGTLLLLALQGMPTGLFIPKSHSHLGCRRELKPRVGTEFDGDATKLGSRPGRRPYWPFPGFFTKPGSTPSHTELFPLCGNFGLWITSLWHYMPDVSREGRGGGVCPDCSGRGGVACRPGPNSGARHRFFVRP